MLSKIDYYQILYSIFYILIAFIMFPRIVNAQTFEFDSSLLNDPFITPATGEAQPNCPYGRSCNDTYQIQFDSDSGEATTSASLNSSVGEPYIHPVFSNSPLTFSLTADRMDFGSIKEARLKTQTTDIILDSAQKSPYQIIAIQTRPFQSVSGNTITPTICNGGNDTCTVRLAQPWTSRNTYGWGFSLAGPAHPIDFLDDSYFRPFEFDKPIPLINDESGAGTHSLTIKVSISNNHPEGNYYTSVKLIAIPNL